MDPPYGRGWGQRMVPAVLLKGIVSEQGLLVLEHEAGESVPESVKDWGLSEQRAYGRTRISFYQRSER